VGWWQKFREFDRRGLLFERVERHLAYTSQGYVVNRWIFRAYFLVLLLCIVAVAVEYRAIGWQSMYFSCDAENLLGCENPCYGEPDCGVFGSLQYVALIPPGEGFGVPPDPAYEQRVRGLVFLAVWGFLVAFALNHGWYNRGRPVAFLFPKLEVD